jgi:rubrerythrin
MDQKAYEQTQKPKSKRKRYRPLIRRKHLRAVGTTAVKKNKGKVKMNEYVLELETEIKELKQSIKEYVCPNCGYEFEHKP